MKKNILFIWVSLVPTMLMAHSSWISVQNKGRVEKEVKVEILFGEIRSNIVEKGIKWYGGDIFRNFNAKIKSQNSSESKSLELFPSENSLSAKFTPQKVGIYQLVAYNETAPIKHYQKYGLGALKDSIYLRTTFEATAWKNLQEGNVDLKPMMKYDIVPYPAKNGYGSYDGHQSTWRVKEKVYAVFYINNICAKNKEIKIYSPDGWMIVTKTNDKGIFHFTPYRKGTYQAIYQIIKKTEGVYRGKKYDTSRVKVITNMNIE